jgi:hypothetical protein
MDKWLILITAVINLIGALINFGITVKNLREMKKTSNAARRMRSVSKRRRW